MHEIYQLKKNEVTTNILKLLDLFMNMQRSTIIKDIKLNKRKRWKKWFDLLNFILISKQTATVEFPCCCARVNMNALLLHKV